jgi:4,5-DOPA dioxygenase extradiol
MPAVFIGHGTPFNALLDNSYTPAWTAFGRQIPRPKAILVISAHCYIGATAATAMPRPPTVHARTTTPANRKKSVILSVAKDP